MKELKQVLFFLTMVIFIGCGNSNTTENTTTAQGYYIDSALEGVDYICGSQKGKTTSKGMFIFEKSKGCTFKLGNLVLRELNASSLENNITIFEDNIDVARFLQTIDNDYNASNGIKILNSFEKLSVDTLPRSTDDLKTLVENFKQVDSNYTGSLVSLHNAFRHLMMTTMQLKNKKIKNQNTYQSFESNDTAYSRVLIIPALAKATLVNGEKQFTMNINVSETEIFTNIQTKTYGINRSILGETIRIHNGDDVRITYINNLEEATTMHGHGMHLPAVMDGGPMNKIQAGESWTTHYTVKQNACTNWYHPHFMGKTAKQVYMGLSGLIILDDNESDALDLPKDYGVDDIPLILQDKRFNTKGQINFSPTAMEARTGYQSPTLLSNSLIKPYVEVASKKVRFRILNASNDSLYDLAFSDNRSFYQIATDNSFLEKPVSLQKLLLTPGERAEIVVDFKDDLGKEIILKELKSKGTFLKIKVTTTSSNNNPLPSTLTSHTKYDSTNAVRTRIFNLDMARGEDGKPHMSINGKTMKMSRIDEIVPLNDIEIWEINNSMAMEHNFHIHSTHFYPLTRDGNESKILPNEQGYKDTIRLAPLSKVRVVVKLTDYPDDKTGYMYHCHFLAHEDDGMMGQFTIVEGQAVVNVEGKKSLLE